MSKTICTDRGFELIKDYPGEYHITDKRRDKWAGRHSGHIQWSEYFGAYLGWHSGMADYQVIRRAELQDCWAMMVERCLIDFPEAA